MRETIDKSLIKLSAQVGNIDNYVIIMNWQTMKKFLSELSRELRYKNGCPYTPDFHAVYKGHNLVYDMFVPDGEVCIMNWDDYARERDAFNQRVGLHF